MDLNTIRKQVPELSGLDDQSAINVLQAAYYPDRSTEEIADRLGVKLAPTGSSAKGPKRPLMSLSTGSAVNDFVTEGVNALAGGVGAAANFVAPGNSLSKGINQFIEDSQGNFTDEARIEKERLSRDIEQANGLGEEAKAALRYVVENPGMAAAQAVGSFALPGGAVKAVGGAARLAGAGARGVARAGLAGGAAAGASMSGGDAAGTAYDLVKKAGGTEEQAVSAAREASVVPAMIGAAGGMSGAEKLLAGAGKAGRSTLGRVGGSMGIEGAQNAFEEGSTQYSGQKAAQQYDPSIDPLKGVGAAAAMGGILGAGTGGAVAAITPGDHLRAQKVPETGPLSRASNLALETHAQQLDAGEAPSMPLVAQGPGAQPAVDPIVQRREQLNSQLMDEQVREAIRGNLGDEALNEALYYFNASKGEGLPGKTSERLMALAERIVSDAQLTPITEIDQPQALPMADNPAAPALEAPTELPQIGIDTTPTGVIRVDGEGNAAPEVRADAISTRQAMEEREVLGQQAPRATVQPAPQAPPAAPLAIGLDTTPTGVMLAGEGGVRPETAVDRMRRLRAERTAAEEAQRKADLGLTPDIERAQKMRAGDMGAPNGGPMKTAMAARLAQRRAGGEVVQVDGGWVVRKPQQEVTGGDQSGPAPVAGGDGAGGRDVAGPGLGDLRPNADDQPGRGTGPADAPVESSGSSVADGVGPAGQPDAVTQAANEAATSPTNERAEPTQAQREAGNFKMGHTKVGGLDVTIEYPKGSERVGKGKDGAEWRRPMNAHYGYIKRTTGADGENVDVYVGPAPDADKAFIIDQLNADGSWDEHKVMLGFKTEMAARRAYLSHYPKGWKIGGVKAMSMVDFKTWLKGDTSAPVAAQRAAAPTLDTTPAQSDGHRVIGRAGRTPNTAQNVELRPNKDGTVTPHIEGYEVLDFESGDPVKLPADVSDADAVEAVKKSGSLGKGAKFFSGGDAKPSTPAASRGDGQGMDVSELRKAMQGITRRWKAGPKGGVTVVATVDDLPSVVLDGLKSTGADAQARALFTPEDQAVYLIADRLGSVEEAQFALFHEVYGHLGLRSVLGTSYAQAMTALRRANPHLASEASMWFAKYGAGEVNGRVEAGMSRMEAEREVRLLSTEEALADRAGDAEPLKGWKAFANALQRVLRRLGLNSVADWMETHTEAETLGLLAEARKLVQEGEGSKVHALTGEPVGVAGSRPVASRGTAADFGELTAEQAAALERVGAMGRPAMSPKDQARAAFANIGLRIKQGLVDQFAPLRELDAKAYLLARMSKGADGTLEAAMLYGRPFLRDGVPDVDMKDGGFAKTLASLQGEHQRFLWWVAAQRAERLKSVGLENLFSGQDIATLKALNAGTMADGASRQAVYREALQQLNGFNDSVLKMAAESGLVSDEVAGMFAGQPYVPFYRVMDDGEVKGVRPGGGLSNQKAWKKLKGGTEQISADLLSNVLQNWGHLYAAAAKNRAAVASIDAAVKLGIAYPVEAGTKGSVKVMREGKAESYVVEDEFVMQALSAMSYVSPEWVKPLAKFKHWLTLGVTMNPAFKIKNLIRDSVAAVAQSDLGPNIYANVKAGLKEGSLQSQTYASMLASGGVIRFGANLEDQRSKHAADLVRKAGGKVLDETAGKKLLRQMGDVLSWYNEQGDKFENVNRVALYKTLREKGYDHAEASFAARDLMDFSMSGQAPVVRFLVQTVPFLNARLQGLYKLGRAASENPHKFGSVVGAVAMASLALMLAYEDDEDHRAREDWDRDAYWWFKVGDTAFRVPKPFEVGAFGTLAERSWELMFNDDMTAKRYGDRLSAMLMQTFAFDPTPQALKPLVDIYANQDSFTGRPIESMGMERLKPEDRYDERTSGVARFLGSMGLPDPVNLMKGRYEQLSPQQIDYLTRAYFGWVGATVSGGLDMVSRRASDRGEAPEWTLKKWTQGLAEDVEQKGSSRYVSAFYEQMKGVEQAMASYRDAVKDGDQGRAQAILDDEPTLVGDHVRIQAAKKQITRIGKTMRRIEGDQTLSSEEKLERLTRLHEQRNRVAQNAIRAG